LLLRLQIRLDPIAQRRDASLRTTCYVFFEVLSTIAL
jgi:hypothetical protein